MKADFRLLFFGSDPFSIRILKHLLNRRICHTEVTTKPHTLLDRYAASQGINRHVWPHGVHELENRHNIGLVASFGNMIDETTIRKFKYGLFNVHPSLLPEYRGSTPIQTAIFDDVQETGCTIMRIPPIEKFDIGDIVLQQRMMIRKREYAVELRDRLADLGSLMVEQFLSNYIECVALAKPQDNSKRSMARKLTPEQGHLKFKSESSYLLDRKIRAYTGFISIYIVCLNGLEVYLDGMEEPDVVRQYKLDDLVKNLSDVDLRRQNVKLKQSSSQTLPPGTIFFHKLRHQLCIKAIDGHWLAFKWATPKMKPKMNALDFYNGYLSKHGQNTRMTDS